jgi:hypothetical protein
MRRLTSGWSAVLLPWLVLAGCTSTDRTLGEAPNPCPPNPALAVQGACEADTSAAAPDYLRRIGCQSDFEGLATQPLDATFPGVRSVRVLLDREGEDALYFQNSNTYQLDWDFASAFLSTANGLPLVPGLPDFNRTEYYSPSRRFLLGAVTYYEGPRVWALEIASYDTANAAMIEKLYDAVRAQSYFGPVLVLHPTSVAREKTMEMLESSICRETTSDLLGLIDYQPLNLGMAKGYFRFVTASELPQTYLGYQDIVVLDQVVDDIAPVMGIVTEQFQSPLSALNVLSQNRGTPNMGLRKAMTNAPLRALEKKWVELAVGAQSWLIREVSADEANAWWETKKPPAVAPPGYDTTVTELKNIQDVVPEPADATLLKTAIKTAIPAFGGKASHLSILAKTTGLTVPTAFGVPIYYYDQYMRENGFTDQVAAMLADATFVNDPATRAERLAALRSDMLIAPVDQTFQDLLYAKLAERLPGVSQLSFRPSANDEDLEGYGGAGFYLSATGDATRWDTVLDAVRTVWASVWSFPAFEERRYWGVAQDSVGMALLVHHEFVDEAANGVALTANPFDPEGLEPAFFVNAQRGDSSAVKPPVGVTVDQFLYFFDYLGQPIAYLAHSSLVSAGETVLSNAELKELGSGLDLIHSRFSPAYGSQAGNLSWYAMDAEFKLYPEAGAALQIVFFGVRPNGGRGTDPIATN